MDRNNILIIPAGGIGLRLKNYLNGEKKQFVKINGKTILEYVIEKFFSYIKIQKCIVCVPAGESNEFLKHKYPLVIVSGGEHRQDSIWNALKLLDDDKNSYVIIHDAVRPFFEKQYIIDVVEKAYLKNAAALAVKAKDTIRFLNKNNKFQTLDRNKVWLMQTPQVFRLDILKKAYKKAYKDNFYGTDDVSLVERLKYNVELVESTYKNFKITDEYDFEIAKNIIKDEKILSTKF
jgi:2-C-methyl-D-erythritol 4-phosphate cytidylyltransferase